MMKGTAPSAAFNTTGVAKSYWNSAGQLTLLLQIGAWLLNIQHDVVAYSAATPLSVVTK